MLSRISIKFEFKILLIEDIVEHDKNDSKLNQTIMVIHHSQKLNKMKETTTKTINLSYILDLISRFISESKHCIL